MRISATTLESFRLYMQPEQDWMSEADLIASIKGEFVPTRNVEIGQAFHSVIETPDRYMVPGGYSCNGFSFSDDTMQPMLSLVDRRGLFEVKTARNFGTITLVTRADHICGSRISEFKTTLSGFDSDKYLNSYQWRVMCLLFGAPVVTYRVACLSDHKNSVIELKSVENMSVYPYQKLQTDVLSLVDRFSEFVIAKGLDGLLRARQRAAEAA